MDVTVRALGPYRFPVPLHLTQEGFYVPGVNEDGVPILTRQELRHADEGA